MYSAEHIRLDLQLILSVLVTDMGHAVNTGVVLDNQIIIAFTVDIQRTDGLGSGLGRLIFSFSCKIGNTHGQTVDFNTGVDSDEFGFLRLVFVIQKIV